MQSKISKCTGKSANEPQNQQNTLHDQQIHCKISKLTAKYANTL